MNIVALEKRLNDLKKRIENGDYYNYGLEIQELEETIQFYWERVEYENNQDIGENPKVL